MKRAPLIFLVAMGLYFAALSLPFEKAEGSTRVPLDLAGVEALVVESKARVHIELREGAPALAQYDDIDESLFRATRRGDTLYVHAAHSGYPSATLQLPTVLKRIQLPNGEIAIQGAAGVEALEVASDGSVSVSGKVGHLSLRAVPGREPCEEGCGELQVEQGDIAVLDVDAGDARVVLGDPGRIGAATIRLGRHGRVTVEEADRLDHLHLVRSGAAPPEASE